MRIKSDKSGFKTIMQFMHPDVMEKAAVKYFREGDIDNATMLFNVMDIAVKIAKAIINNSKQIDIAPAQACSLLLWLALIENNQQDLYTVILAQTIKTAIHKELTNYKLKFN